jgi:hypothetical protein
VVAMGAVRRGLGSVAPGGWRQWLWMVGLDTPSRLHRPRVDLPVPWVPSPGLRAAIGAASPPLRPSCCLAAAAGSRRDVLKRKTISWSYDQVIREKKLVAGHY